MITIDAIKSLVEQLSVGKEPNLYCVERDCDDSLIVSKYKVQEVLYEKCSIQLTVMDTQLWMYIIDVSQWPNWFITEEEAKKAINNDSNERKL